MNLGLTHPCHCLLTSDYNECIQRDPPSHDCNIEKNQACHNIPGSYKCLCDYGFAMTADGDCIAVKIAAAAAQGAVIVILLIVIAVLIIR